MDDYNELKEFILSKRHRVYRKRVPNDLAKDYCAKKLSPEERMIRRFEYLTREETPVVLKNERITFLRTIENLPPIFTDEEWSEIKKKRYIHESGYRSNVTPDYSKLIKNGLLFYRNTADEYGKRAIDAILALTERYAEEAERVGNVTVAKTLRRVPFYGARGLVEALQSFRIIHFALWLEGNYHVTVGRFDEYTYPYYKKDLEEGRLTAEEAESLIEEFFLSFNRDSDLYPGVQQGDNGQSMVLGGLSSDGNDSFNELSEICLKASGNLMTIDPKINIRVSKKTPIKVYELGAELTKKGLGFPQYTNDDIAVPALERWGYSHEDAVGYTIAACWELIIPGVGADVANIGALSFAKVIDKALKEDLQNCRTMDDFLDATKRKIKEECDKIRAKVDDVWFIPSPFLSVCMTPAANGRYKYNNFGIHGTGVCTGADSLAAIEKYVFTDKTVSKEEMINAVATDFESTPGLLHKLRYETPKVGQNDDSVDKYLCLLLDYFADALKPYRNKAGGVYRAGTGSAMYYLWHADEIGASPDGRRKGEALGTNFSVSLFAKTGGAFSVIQSLTKPELIKVMNGGPVTLEFASTMWNNEDAEKKFAKFVKAFIDLGGHQLQLNSVDLKTLKDAQKNPEKYERLIVRVWGWSAYFTSLDKCYQDHIISRREYETL